MILLNLKCSLASGIQPQVVVVSNSCLEDTISNLDNLTAFSATSEVVASTNVHYGFTALVSISNAVTDAQMLLNVYSEQQDLNDDEVPLDDPICSWAGDQAEGSQVVEVRDCVFETGVTYYYYLWLDSTGKGALKIQQDHFEVEVDDSISFQCNDDEFPMTDGKNCWDDVYTCLSCCNTNKGLWPYDNRECWIPDTLTRDDCCGDESSQGLPLNADSDEGQQ
jgi:hypothetical protein